MTLESIFRRIQLGGSGLPRPDETARAATYPRPYPSGWYRLCESAELKRGQTRYVECVGVSLVVFRSDVDDTVGVLDAHCPHMGANLAAGKVCDGQLECPFHRWKLCTDGRVTEVPYATRVQKGLRTRSWPVVEQHGMIFFYFQLDRSTSMQDIEAPYSLVEESDVDSGELVYRGSYDAGTVDMHLIEFAENSVDFAHFEPLHGSMLIPFLGLPVPGIKVHHEAEWKLDEEHEHISYFINNPVLHILGKERPTTRATATITFCGPGSVVTFRFLIPEMGEILMYQTHLPTAPLRQQVNFRWFASKRMPRLLVYYVIGNWIAQWRADINIWENKVYRNKPMLVAGDGPVHPMRQWFKQFYETGNSSSATPIRNIGSAR